MRVIATISLTIAIVLVGINIAEKKSDLAAAHFNTFIWIILFLLTYNRKK